MKRIYNDARTFPFTVRVHEKRGSATRRLAARLGCSETEARRLVVDLGFKVVEALERTA